MHSSIRPPLCPRMNPNKQQLFISRHLLLKFLGLLTFPFFSQQCFGSCYKTRWFIYLERRRSESCFSSQRARSADTCHTTSSFQTCPIYSIGGFNLTRTGTTNANRKRVVYFFYIVNIYISLTVMLKDTRLMQIKLHQHR